MLSVIIPIYLIDRDLWKTTLDCLEQVFAQKVDLEVILVDDGSPFRPPDHEYLERPNVTLVQRYANGGYAAAVNTGDSYASGEVMVILNNDAYLKPGCLQALLDHVTPTRIATAVNDHPIHGKDLGSPCFHCWAIHKDTWARLGPLDESFGVGAFEDIDYCFRAYKAGIAVERAPGAEIVTRGAATVSRHPDHEAQFERNRLEIIRRYGGEHAP